MTLLAPLFLLGVVGVALPIWLHLRDEQDPEPRPVASLMLFEPSERRSRTRRRLRRVGLLALRIAVLAAAALAFAEPVWSLRVEPGPGRIPRDVLVVLDTSLSMRHGDRWARARDVARARIDALESGDRAQLIEASDGLRSRTELTSDAGRLRGALEDLEPGLARLSYDDLLPSLEAEMRRLQGGGRREAIVHLISDFQRTGIETRELDASWGGGRIELHGVGRDGEANWFVETLRASPTTEAPGWVEATIRGVGTEATEKSVVLELDGEPVGRETVKVPASGRATVRVALADLPPGESRATLRVEAGDGLPADDERSLVVVRRASGRVLLLASDPRDRAARYYASALTAAEGSGLEGEVRRPAELGDLTGDDLAAVVIADATLPRSALDRVREYVRAGGGALLTLGSRLVPDAGGGGRALDLTGHDLRGTRSGDVAEHPAGAGTAIDHPALGDLSGWREVRVFERAVLRPREGDTVLLRVGEEPLVIEHPLGEGRVLILASSLDGRWNDLPLRPVFLGFVRASARYLADLRDPVRHARVGEQVSLRGPSIQAVDPSGGRVFSLDQTQGGGRASLEQRGFYEIREPGHVRWIAVNLDPRESDVRPVDAARLDAWRGGLASAEPAVRPAARGVEAEDVAPGVSLAGWLLVLLAALVAIESVVANSRAEPGRKGS